MDRYGAGFFDRKSAFVDLFSFGTKNGYKFVVVVVEEIRNRERDLPYGAFN